MVHATAVLFAVLFTFSLYHFSQGSMLQELCHLTYRIFLGELHLIRNLAMLRTFLTATLNNASD